MFYYTHHSDMDAPQYVHVDVPSDVPVAWMFYDTYHSNVDASQYEYIHVP